MKKLLIFILFAVVFSPLITYGYDFSALQLGKKITVDGLEYDTFYYVNGKKQALKQVYDQISIPHGSNLNSLNNIDFNGIPAVNLIKDIAFQGTSVNAYYLAVDKNDRESWFKFRKLLVRNNIPAWPVVTYHVDKPFLLNGEMNMYFYDNTSEEKREEILKRFNLEIVEIQSNDSNYYTVKLPLNANPFSIANELYEKGLVKWAQPEWAWYFEKRSTIPNDTYYSHQWHLNQILAEHAWDIETGSSDIKIGIVDSGVDTDHPDLLVLSGYNFLDNDNDPNPPYNSTMYTAGPHGTSCAGLAAAKTNNGIGVAGVCWGCSIIPIRMIADNQGLYGSQVYKALVWPVDAGAYVVSNSWGANDCSSQDAYGNCTQCAYVPADSNQSQAIDYARTNGRGGKGTVMLWAAGNSHCPTSMNGFLKDNDMLVISALEATGNMASYSNYGDEIDLAAGAGKYTTDIVGNDGYNGISGDTSYTSQFAGTSAATPVAAGAVAVMMATNPDMDFSGIMNCAKVSVTAPKNCSEGNVKTLSDSWLADGSAEHSACFGFGTVDLNKMVHGAKDGTCGECVATSTTDLCWGEGNKRDDDCDGIIDNDCEDGGIGKAGDACSTEDDCLNTSEDPVCITESGWEGGYCSGDCKLNSDCYNSIAGVVCYDGKCVAKCDYNEVRSGYECISEKILPEGTELIPECGNDIVEGNEKCDGNTKPCKEINSNYISGDAKCTTTCFGFDTSDCVSGGGDTGDTGDTGNSGNTGNSGDTSDTGNTGNSGNSGDTGNSGNTSSENKCGNGTLDVGEQCDDGNLVDGDGCSAYCVKEGPGKSSGGCSVLSI